MHMAIKHKKGSLRIIGGQWRSQLVRFSGSHSLRPTPDAVRETLFNWLTPIVQGATCLDLFSGSGALGFEAASRGALRVDLVDQNQHVCQQLLRTRESLSADQVHIHYQGALRFLADTHHRFNIVFLDPPFQSSLSTQIIKAIEQSKILHDQSLVYLEKSKKYADPVIPRNWKIFKEKTTASIVYRLYERRHS